MESIKDIIAEMRKDMPRVVDAKVILRNYADRIEEVVTNCNQLKTREALEYLRDASREFCHLILNSKYNKVFDKYKHPEVAKISDAIANAGLVLAEPPRNCDVGSVDEQERRSNYNPNDVDAECWRCPLYKHRNTCEFAWAQLPYEKEGEE